MGAGELQPPEEAEEEEEEEENWPTGPSEERRSSEPHWTDTTRGPGRLSAHIFQRSSAGRREKRY